MSNPHKGEVSFEADGKTHTLRLDTNAICSLEDEVGIGILDIMRRMDSGSMSTLRIAYREALVNGSAERRTLNEVGELIDELGYVQAAALLSKALQFAFPPPAEAEDGTNPRRRGAGTIKAA